MPATYTLHVDLGFVATRFSGVVRDDDFHALYSAIFHDPSYVLGTHELADLRASVDLRLTAVGMRRVERLTRRTYGDAPQTFRTAVLAPSDVGFGIGRMYSAFSEGGPESVAVFRTPEEAFAWLGLEPIEMSRLHVSRG